MTKDCDCFASVISTHGGEVPRPGSTEREHILFTSERGGRVKTEDVLKIFNDKNCKALKGKPRMFFIQVTHDIRLVWYIGICARLAFLISLLNTVKIIYNFFDKNNCLFKYMLTI